MSSMTSKSKANGSTGTDAISTPAWEMGGAWLEQEARDEDIRRRAYEIYLSRGEEPGLDLDDWLQAEREIAGAVLSLARAS
jgi:Protein of unknown function (DUF2934)